MTETPMKLPNARVIHSTSMHYLRSPEHDLLHGSTGSTFNHRDKAVTAHCQLSTPLAAICFALEFRAETTPPEKRLCMLLKELKLTLNSGTVSRSFSFPIQAVLRYHFAMVSYNDTMYKLPTDSWRERKLSCHYYVPWCLTHLRVDQVSPLFCASNTHSAYLIHGQILSMSFRPCHLTSIFCLSHLPAFM
jgi:hypothetical protein